MANYKYVIDFASNSAQFSKQLGDINANIEAINKTAGMATKTIGALFAGAQLKDAGVEMVDLAGRTQGVQEAFEKLNRPGLLDELKKATSGTVDELTLMKNAVKAEKFKIPLDQLATYFKFATNTAAETGESVDYLVDSIITGLGRESPLILDNLGISAKELSDRVKEVGDFSVAAGQIIKEMMERNGEVTLTAAQTVMVWKANISNVKAEIGDRLIPVVTLMNEAIQWVTKHSRELLAIIGGLTAAFVAYKTITMSAAAAQMLITAAGNIKAFFELARGIKSAAEAQVLLSMVTKASPIGIIAGIVAAAAGAMLIFGNTTKKATDEQKGFNEQLAKTAELAANFAKLSDKGGVLGTMSTDQLTKLKGDIQYQLDAEKEFNTNLLVELKKRLAADEQLKKLSAQMAEQGVTDIQKAGIQRRMELRREELAADLQAEANKMNLRTASLKEELANIDAILLARGGEVDAGLTIAKIQQQIADIEELRKNTSSTQQLAIYRQQIEALREQLNELQNIGAAMDKIQTKTVGGVASSKGVTGIAANPTKLTAEPLFVPEQTQAGFDYFVAIGQELQNVTNLANIFTGAIWEMSDAFENLFAGNEAGFKDMVTVMLGGLQTIINGLLAQAIAGMIAGESSKGLIGLLTASVGIAALVGLWKSKVPAFADGGIVYGPTMGLMGEYPGASSNPEVIAPLSKLQSMIGGGGMGGEVQFRIEGTTLVGVLANQRSKTKGITGR